MPGQDYPECCQTALSMDVGAMVTEHRIAFFFPFSTMRMAYGHRGGWGYISPSSYPAQ